MTYMGCHAGDETQYDAEFLAGAVRYVQETQKPALAGAVANSRPGGVTVDGQLAGSGLRTGGSTWEIPVAGRGGVPAGAASVVVTVAVSGSSGSGFVMTYTASWDPPLNTGYTPVTQYTVKQFLQNGFQVSAVSVPASATTYTPNDPIPAGTYYVEVLAVNSAGERGQHGLAGARRARGGAGDGRGGGAHCHRCRALRRVT